MNMKKFAIMALILTLALIAAGCGVPSAQSGTTDNQSSAANTTTSAAATTETVPPDATTGDGTVIGLSMNALDVFQTEWLERFKAICNEKGVELIVTNAENSVDKQLSDVDTLIERKPNVIVIKATDSEGAVPAFEACTAAGIPTVDCDMGARYDNTFRIASNQFDLGLMQNAWFIQQLESDPDFKLKLGYVWGTQGMSTMFERYNGFLDGLVAAYPDRVEVLVEKVCNWSASEAMAVTEDWLQAFPEMNAILSQSDEMALGCINVLQAANVNFDEFYVCAFDGSPEARDAIRNGSMKASVFFNKKASAEIAFDYAIRIAGGENLMGQSYDYTNDVNVSINAENLNEILAAVGIEK